MRLFGLVLVLLLAFGGMAFAFGNNGTIMGAVLLENNNPAAGATVVLYNVTNGTVNQTTSAANGSYAFTGLLYDTTVTIYHVNATSADNQTRSSTADLLLNDTQPEAVWNLTLNISNGGNPPATNGTVNGTVSWSNSTAIVNATVRIFYANNSLLSQTNSTAGGAYGFTNLTYIAGGTSYSLQATAPDGSNSSRVNISLNGTSYEVTRNISITAAPPASNGTNGTVSGYVLFANSTISDAQVTLIYNGVNTTQLSDGSGYFTFANLNYFVNTQTHYSLLAKHPTNSSLFSQTFDLQLTTGSYNVSQNLTLSGGQGGDNGGPCGSFSINGTVNISDGSPIGDRNINVNAFAGNGGGSAAVNATTGKYQITCLFGGNYTVGANGPGLQFTQANATITNSNATVNLTLSPMMGGPGGCNGNASISGYVRASNGTGITNVNIFVGINNNAGGSGGPGGPSPGGPGGDFCGGNAMTDNNGLYNVTGLKAGSYMINAMPAQGSGYGEVHMGPESAVSVATNSTSVSGQNITLQRAGYVVGCVLGNSSGTLVPVGGAFVNVFAQVMGGAFGFSQTNATGCFNVSMSAGSNFQATVNPPYGTGYSTAQIGMQPGTAFSVVAGETTNLGNITLNQGAGITGYVLNSSGGGIAWVSVNARPKTMNMMGGSGGEWGFAQTNSSGYFSINGLKANSTYILEAHPDPSSDYSIASVEVTMGSGSTSRNITLGTGNSLSGRVTCGGVNVSYAPVNVMRMSGANGPGKGPMEMGNMEAGGFSFAMTDQNGLYSVRGINEGNYSMRVDMPWNGVYTCSAYSGTVEVTVGSNTKNVVLSTAANITGVVNSSTGPVAFAFIDAFIPSADEMGSGPMDSPAHAQTDSSGRYTLKVKPSDTAYVIHVQAPWNSFYAGQETQLLANSTSQNYSLNFTLSSGGSIRGRVLTASGSAVQFAFVNAFSPSKHSFGFGATGSDGTFTVSGLSAGSDFNLFVQPSSSGETIPTYVTNVVVTDGGTTDLGDISATSADSSLLLTVNDGGSPVASVQVNAWMPFTPFFGSGTTNSTGQTNIKGLSAGSYNVFIGGSSGRPPVFRNVSINGSTSLTFDYATSLGTLYTVNGTVVNSTGGTIASAEVGLWNEATRFGMHTTANASGFYSFSGVPDGTYQLGSRQSGYYDQLASLTVTASTTQNITLSTINQANVFGISGLVVSNSSATTSSYTIALIDATNATRYSAFNLTNSTGGYSFDSVPPATYRISAIVGNASYGVDATVSNANVAAMNITIP